ERDQAAAGRTAHERVVDHDHALAVDHFTHRVVLDADAEVATLLRGMDECAADVVVPDQAELVCDTALLGEAECRRVRGVRNAEHAVSLRRLLACELAAERAARTVDADAPYA